MENEEEKQEQSKHEGGGGGGGRCLGAGKKRAKERDKQRKKLRRKRKRREEARLREEEGKERSEQEEEECEREADAPRHDEKKKRMYGVCLSVEEMCALKKEAAESAKEKENISSSSCPLAKLYPDPDPSFRRPQDSAFNQPQQSAGVAEGTTDKPSEKKQHKGLRCKKCFALLLRDQDFEHRNGRLWLTNASVLGANKPGGWDGLCFQHNNNKVYCQNMHYVGQREAVAWTNLTRHVPVLRADKTTFHANFPHLLPPPSSATRNPSATAP